MADAELEHGMRIVEADEQTTLADPVVEFCEQCGNPMPDGCIGWCPDCTSPETQTAKALEDFYAWGGWRRAFGEYTDEEWELVKHLGCSRRLPRFFIHKGGKS